MRLDKVGLIGDEGILALVDVPLEVVHRFLDGGEGAIVVEVGSRAEGVVIVHAAANLVAVFALVEDEVGVSLSITETEVEVDVAALVDAHSEEVGGLCDEFGDCVDFADGEVAFHCSRFFSGLCLYYCMNRAKLNIPFRKVCC